MFVILMQKKIVKKIPDTLKEKSIWIQYTMYLLFYCIFNTINKCKKMQESTFKCI